MCDMTYLRSVFVTIGWRSSTMWMRVPGLPIRDCARGCNKREHTRTQLSAIDVTAKVFFERLYLVPGMGTFGPWVNCPSALTTPTVHYTTISRFPCNFFPRMAPNFFGHHDSPSNQAKSRYPHVDWGGICGLRGYMWISYNGVRYMWISYKIKHAVVWGVSVKELQWWHCFLGFIITLQHTATHCNTLQLTATHYTSWITLQLTATHCTSLITLQHTATHCNILHLNPKTIVWRSRKM